MTLFLVSADMHVIRSAGFKAPRPTPYCFGLRLLAWYRLGWCSLRHHRVEEVVRDKKFLLSRTS